MPAIQQNLHETLDSIIHRSDIGWVKKNTAILIIHGIGDQLPMETLDQFGRGLIKQYKTEFNVELKLKHETVTKPSDGGVWFDNVIRLHKIGSDHYIDLYEYYWAHYTEDKASWKDINTWLQGAVKGANSFYKRNAELGQQYKDKSPFFNTKTGKFNVGVYRIFMSVFSHLFFALDIIYHGIIWLVGHIPFLGKVADKMLESYTDTLIHKITNIAGDVVVYNVVDPKSKFYEVRRNVHDGAVKAIRFLIERKEEKSAEKKFNSCKFPHEPTLEELEQYDLYYPSVIIAGHSLGTQVSYDAINKINMLVNKGEIKTYNRTGECLLRNNGKIHDQLNGYITFGSPLDKIVFFLRENVPDEEYIRQQILDNFHCFKQRDLDERFNNATTNKEFVKVETDIKRLLEDMQWRNYYDEKDYISGGLDYYSGLTNINCKFKTGKLGFTHSYYWKSEKFFLDIIANFLK